MNTNHREASLTCPNGAKGNRPGVAAPESDEGGLPRDLSRLGSDERNLPKAKAREG